MWQHWVNLLGLTLDFMGVLLLANEWRISIGAEAREAEIAASEEMFKPNPMMPKSSLPQQPVFDWMRERENFRQLTFRSRQVRQARQGYYRIAMLMVTLGFLLQIIGSWPESIRF